MGWFQWNDQGQRAAQATKTLGSVLVCLSCPGTVQFGDHNQPGNLRRLEKSHVISMCPRPMQVVAASRQEGSGLAGCNIGHARLCLVLSLLPFNDACWRPNGWIQVACRRNTGAPTVDWPGQTRAANACGSRHGLPNPFGRISAYAIYGNSALGVKGCQRQVGRDGLTAEFMFSSNVLVSRQLVRPVSGR